MRAYTVSQISSLRHGVCALFCLLAWPAHAAPLLVVDAVPDPSAPWLAAQPARYAQWLEQRQVGVFLQQVAPLFATHLDDTHPLRVHLVALHAGDHLRARTLGDDLAVQVREEDTPDRRTDVIVHEAVHALQQRSGVTTRIVGLSALAQQRLDEALATAIGQGLWRWLDHALWEALGETAWRQGRDRYAEDVARPWYVADQAGVEIDAWAHALVPFVTLAVAYGTPLEASVGALQATWQQAQQGHTLQGR